MGYISRLFGDIQISGVEPNYNVHERHSVSGQTFWSIVGELIMTEVEVLDLKNARFDTLNNYGLYLDNNAGVVAALHLNKVGRYEFSYLIPHSNNPTYNSYRSYDPKFSGSTSLDPSSLNKNPIHTHSWKKYEGFTKVDYYCDCGEKRDSI